ncbi:hypothetical protein [Bacillus thuringiensis]|uniref:hypothetical protein n=1 Tax=Bacillus thuringiensis TaxID=1428 RepID=UPI0021D6897C|nr:hypothetical protein [Bacillus thuringiensis]MCU7667858.1 hypothetical protein [Bacillus thuringiensis]
MQKNIVDLAITEAASYMEKLNTSRTYQNIVEKYIDKHNKGIFVDFTFNTNTATGLFRYFEHTYNFKSSKEVIKPFSRDKVIKISNLNSKVRKKKRELNDKEEVYKKIQSRYRKLALHFGLKMPKTYELPEDKFSHLIDSYSKGDTMHVSTSVLELELENISKQIKIQNNLEEMLGNTSNNIPYVEYELKHVEEEFFKCVLRKYFSLIQEYSSRLFDREKVYVIYNEKEWLSSYKKERERGNNLNSIQTTGDSSKIDTFMILFIQKNFNMFDLQVNKEEFSYAIGNHSTRTRFKNTPDEDKESEFEKWEKILLSFQEQHSEFSVAVSVYNDIVASVGKSEESAHILLKYLFDKFPTELINEYNYITGEKRKAREKRTSFKPKNIEFPTIVQTFPNLNFVIRKVQDMNYWYALQQKKYNDVMCSISNDEYELTLYELKEDTDSDLTL